MDSHSNEHGAADAHAGHSVEEAKAHMRTYAIIGVALMIGTGLTVWAGEINFGGWNIIIALAIAIVKGSLVVSFFMHLISEKKMIYSVMVCTVFFFAALMFLTLWSMHPANVIQLAH
jgi:cytochrome c oxidase subunit 4